MMLAPSSGLLRAGLALKLSQIKLRDAIVSARPDPPGHRTPLTSYAVAAGLFAARASFLIAACLVGLAALFRWIEIHYGQFRAFGADRRVAAGDRCDLRRRWRPARLKRPTPHFPSLTSRLRVAIKANPLQPDQIDAAADTAAAVLLAPRDAGTAAQPQPAASGVSRRARQQEHSGRPDPDGDVAGLGGHATAAAGATNGRLMSGRRPSIADNLAADRGHGPPDPDRAALFSGRATRAAPRSPVWLSRRPAHCAPECRIRTRTPGRQPACRFRGPSWKTILWRTYERSDDDRLLATAAGVVFFGLLAVFPAVTALVSCYGLFADPVDHRRQPADAGADAAARARSRSCRTRSPGCSPRAPPRSAATFLFGLALALWSANAGVKAIIDALNVVYEERETRSFIRLNLLSLAFTTGGIAALLLMVSAVVAFPLAFDHIGLESGERVHRWPGPLAAAVRGPARRRSSVLYRFGPSRPAARWEWTGAGTLAAALLWIAGSAALSWYLSNFGNYNATYGSLGAAIGLMMWMWMSATIVLFGAELNSEIERQTAGIRAAADAGRRVRATAIRGTAVPAVSKEH